jgi:hypothetical protein
MNTNILIRQNVRGGKFDVEFERSDGVLTLATGFDQISDAKRWVDDFSKATDLQICITLHSDPYGSLTLKSAKDQAQRHGKAT